jgi:hypothetical protein
MPPPRQLALWLVAAAGALCGHEIGYRVAGLLGPAAGGSGPALHAYVPLASAVLAPAAVVAVLVLAVRSARSAGLRDVGAGRLVLAQLVICTAQEVLERVPSGAVGDVWHDRGVRWALAAQVLVAAGIAVMLRTASKAMAVIARAGGGTLVAAARSRVVLGAPMRTEGWWTAAVVASDIHRRGPPAGLLG